MVRLLRPGLLTTVQDLGRHGGGHLGIGTAGAADPPALQLANALVGNRADAAALEITLLGPVLEVDTDVCVAITGAPLPHARANAAPLPAWQRVLVPAGARIELGPTAQGCRSYLALSGGIRLPPWRGSRATDVNSALGPLPRALVAGDVLPLGPAPAPRRAPGYSLDPRPWFDPNPARRLRLLPGAHTERLDADSRRALSTAAFTITAQSNRVGLRLHGPPLRLAQPLELVSTGVTAGTMQLPAAGDPIIMGPEHPVTGGYPRIAQLAAVDWPILAQRRPGTPVRFAWWTLPEALEEVLRRQQALQQLLRHIHARETAE